MTLTIVKGKSPQGAASLSKNLVAGCAILFCSAVSVSAIDIVGYDPAVNDRFDSATFPTTFSPNPNPGFVAAGYDLSSWSFDPLPYAGTTYRAGYALITPKHVVGATHIGVVGPVIFFGTEGQATPVPFSGGGSGIGTGFPFSSPDLSVCPLISKLEGTSGVQWAPVLDLAEKVSGTTSYTGWNGQTVFVMGRNGGDAWTGDGESPRVAQSTISTVAVNASANQSYFTIPGVGAGGSITFISGDSGGPTYIPWTDPSGAKLLTVVGTHAAVSSSYNYDNFVGSDQALSLINAHIRTSGYAVQMVGDASRFWVGGEGTDFTQGQAWTGGAGPDDFSYVGFDKSQAASQAVTVGAGAQARGLIFYPTSAGDVGFTLSGGDLALGRGGLINYSTETQTIASNVTLTDNQWWIARKGNLQVSANINTNGKLLIIDGDADTTLAGKISGLAGANATTDGALAKEGAGTLRVVGGKGSDYKGRTTIHSGRVIVSGASPLGSGQIHVESTGSLIISGGTDLGNELFLQAGSEIGGTGRYFNYLVIGNQVTAAPGDTDSAIGKLSGAGIILEGGGIFDLQVSRLGGTGPVQFDTLDAFGYNAIINSTSANPFTIRLDSMGDLTLGLQPNESTSWAIFTASSTNPIYTINGFSADKFVLDNTNFLPDGNFSLTQSGKSIFLNFTAVPEPSIFILCLMGVLGMGLVRSPRARIRQ